MTQIEAQILQNMKGLPLETLKEISHFIQFIKRQKIKKNSLNNINLELLQLDKIAKKHLEEEFKNYQKIYPKNEK